MPVHRQKKDTTPHPPGSTQEQPASPLPDQQEFHQHLRALAQSAVRTVLELVMREELDSSRNLICHGRCYSLHRPGKFQVNG